MAMPASVRPRNQARAAMTTGTTATISMWLPRRMTGSMVRLRSIGDTNPPSGPAPAPNSSGMSSSMPPSTWARPIVATVRTSREERAKRRITRNSTMPPRAKPSATPTPMATK